MSWSVSAAGKPSEAASSLADQFKFPLDPASGLQDEGERTTVQAVSDLLDQVLGTFDESTDVTVTASGYMSCTDWETKAGRTQTVNIAIAPTPPSSTTL